MKSAIILSGGKQYHVSEGDTVKVDKIAGSPGEAIEFKDVLFVGGDNAKVGKPRVSGAKVEAEIVEQGRHPKLVIFKFRRRKRYRRKTGHRQDYTAVKVTAITG